MRLKIVLQYSDSKTENILMFQKPETSIQKLKEYVVKQFNFQSPQIVIDGFRVMDDQIIGNIFQNNEIIFIQESSINKASKIVNKTSQKIVQSTNNQKNLNQQQKQSDTSSEDEIIEKPQVLNKSQPKPIIKSNLVVKKPLNNQTQQIQTIQKPKIVQTISEEESSSEDDQEFIKKQTTTNPIIKQTETPEDEFKRKQAGWKQTFIKGAETSEQQKKSQNIQIKSTQPNVVKQQTKQPSNENNQEKQIIQTQSIFLNEYIRVQNTALLEDPTLLEQEDQILFKYKYLDIERCEPAESQELTGIVKENNHKEKKLIIKSKTLLTLSYSEIIEIQINIAKIKSQARIASIKLFAEETNKQQPKQSIREEQTVTESQKIEVIDPFGIGPQINYYYCDKNYNKDDFIQQHSAQDPEKYMQLKLLLNFPKVKAKIKNVEELLDVINLFLSKSKADIVNFELKQNQEGTWMIRKKVRD